MGLRELDRMGFYFKARGLFDYSTNQPRFNSKPRTAVIQKENIRGRKTRTATLTPFPLPPLALKIYLAYAQVAR